MLKKIILSVMAVVLLMGSESIFATETNATAGAKQEKQVLQSGVKRGRQQEFGRYFNALTDAYRENDRETMGQMLRKMNQFRQNQQKAKAVPGKRGQDLPKRRGRGMGRQGQGMGGRGQGMGRQGQSMGGRGRGMGWQGQGMGGRGQGMGWQDRGNQRRKMNVPQRDDMAGEEFDWDL